MLIDQPFFGLRLTNSSFVPLGEGLPCLRLFGEGRDAFLRLGDQRAHLFEDARSVGGHALDPVDFFSRLDRELFGKKVRRQQRAELLELLAFALDDEGRIVGEHDERCDLCVPKTLNPTIVVMQSTEDAA